jgi:hypothetical protein
MGRGNGFEAILIANSGRPSHFMEAVWKKASTKKKKKGKKKNLSYINIRKHTRS